VGATPCGSLGDRAVIHRFRPSWIRGFMELQRVLNLSDLHNGRTIPAPRLLWARVRTPNWCQPHPRSTWTRSGPTLASLAASYPQRVYGQVADRRGESSEQKEESALRSHHAKSCTAPVGYGSSNVGNALRIRPRVGQSDWITLPDRVSYRCGPRGPLNVGGPKLPSHCATTCAPRFATATRSQRNSFW